MDPTCMKKGRHWDLFQGFSVPLSDHVTPKDRFTTMHFLASHTPWKMHGNLRLLDAWKIGKRNKCRWFFVVPFFGMAKTCPLDGTLFNGWWIPCFFWSRKNHQQKHMHVFCSRNEFYLLELWREGFANIFFNWDVSPPRRSSLLVEPRRKNNLHTVHEIRVG